MRSPRRAGGHDRRGGGSQMKPMEVAHTPCYENEIRKSSLINKIVMPGLVPGIHVHPPLRSLWLRHRVDARDKPGHDAKGYFHPRWCAPLRAGRLSRRHRVGVLRPARGCCPLAPCRKPQDRKTLKARPRFRRRAFAVALPGCNPGSLGGLAALSCRPYRPARGVAVPTCKALSILCAHARPRVKWG